MSMPTTRTGNWIGRFRALLRSPAALLAVAIDASLVGAGLAMAAGAAAFAVFTVAGGDHKPDVYGMKYLAIYAQPRKTPKPAGNLLIAIGAGGDAQPGQTAKDVGKPPIAIGDAGDAQPGQTANAAGETGTSPESPAGGEIDMAPVGSIGPATGMGGFALVSAQPGIAWLWEGTRIVAVRKGDEAPGLGQIVDILQRDGRWFLIGESGTALLSREPPTGKDGPAREPFNRRMIFGDDQ